MKQFILSAVCTSFVWCVFLFTPPVHSDAASVVISEIGAYEQNGIEWIEIVNVSDASVDLSGWKFWEAETNHGLTAVTGDMLLEPGEYAIITQNDVSFLAAYPSSTATIIDSSWSTLNESGEAIGLRDSNGTLVESFTYSTSADSSLERIDLEDMDYTSANWREHPNSNTAGMQNFWYEAPSVPTPNVAPVPSIVAPPTSSIDMAVVFDGSGSTDSDGIIEGYLWEFDSTTIDTEDTLTYVFHTSGTKHVVLTVTDNDGASASTTHSIVIYDVVAAPPTTTPPTTTIESAALRINEILTDPATGTEWIELYNSGTTSIDLSLFTLRDGVGAIAAPTGTIIAGEFFVVDLPSSKLNNGGDELTLLLDTTTVDSIIYGSWEGSTIAAPAKGHTLARSIDGSGVFVETTSTTYGLPNIIAEPVVDAPSTGGGSSGGGGGAVTTITYEPGDIVINELASDPADGEVEFVEFFNTTDAKIILAGWYMTDGSEAETPLSGSIAAGGYYVLEQPNGNLNNSGDMVSLYSKGGDEIDRVTYGSWDDGILANNAAVPSDPASLARIVDGQDTNYDSRDFALTHTVTPGEANVIASVLGEIVFADPTAASYQGTVLLSEVLPNPDGSDSEAEFIELYNAGSADILLDNWQLGDGSKTRYTFAGTMIKAGGYLALYRSDTGIALNNSGGDEVSLYNPAGSVIDSIVYTGSAPNGQSYARGIDSWGWTIAITPAAANDVQIGMAAPEIILEVDSMAAVGAPIQFDASDSVDLDSTGITFAWNFGDGNTDEGDVVEHSYASPGVYTAVLTVVDTEGNESAQEMVISISSNARVAGDFVYAAAALQITEFLPNPEGSDTTEFIELFNPTNEDIDLSLLKLDDEEGGSRAYTIPNGTVLGAGAYKVFGKQDTKLALNNTADSVRVLYPNGTILLDISYDDAVEGASYTLSEEGRWSWSSTETPGRSNIATVPIANTTSRTASNDSKYTKPIIHTSLEFLRSEDIGDMVSVSGVVAVVPGVLGSQYFYIVGSPGVQVYMYSKDFPTLRVGDKVQVTGEISEALGETRIKVRNKSDIVVIDHVGMPTPTGLDISEISEVYEGWLAGVDGEITEVKSNYMYVDDGTAELKVYFKRGAGIPSGTFELGELVRVIGLVSQTKDGYQLLPRSADDITTTGMATSVAIEKQIEKEADQAETVEKYLTATAGGLTSIMFGLGVQAHGGRMQSFARRMVKRLRRRE